MSTLTAKETVQLCTQNTTSCANGWSWS